MHLTFKEYLESKERLKQALQQTPVRIVEYTVRKYCKLPVGETKDEKQLISLKPKNNFVINWYYENVNNPTPASIKFKGINGINPDDEFTPLWESWKLEKWLINNAKEEKNE